MGKVRIFLIFFLLVCSTSYATNYLRFDFQNTSTKPVTNVKNMGWISDSTTCGSVRERLWNSQIINSNEDLPLNSVVLSFPIQSEVPSWAKKFYLVSYHDEYLTRSQCLPIISQLTGAGSSFSNPYFDSAGLKTFAKQPNCASPISLSVVNNIRENLPVSVTSGAQLDATTKSALSFPFPDWIPQEAYSVFEIETTLRLRIYKYNSTTSKNIGSPIHSENVVKRIYYDDTVNVAFTDWMPPEQIDQFNWYNITVESDVTDPKCSSKVNQRASKLLRVWRDDPRNECYSLIDTDGLVFSPVDFSNRQPEVGQEVTITFRKLSNYANDYEPWDPLFTLTPQDTNINLKLKEQGSQDVVITKTLPKNSDDNFKDVSVTWTPEKAGLFTMELYADAATCPVSEDRTSDIYLQTLTVFEGVSNIEIKVPSLRGGRQPDEAILLAI